MQGSGERRSLPSRGEESEEEEERSGTLNSTGSGSSREEGERLVIYRHILTSIVESEAVYLECLSVSLQYMKAMKVRGGWGEVS